MPAIRTRHPSFYNPHNLHESSLHRGVPLSAFGTALRPAAPYPRPPPLVLDGPGFLRLSNKLAYDSMREQNAFREWLKVYRELHPEAAEERTLTMEWEADIETEWPTPAEMRMLQRKGTTIFGPVFDPYKIKIYYGGGGEVVVKNVVKRERSRREVEESYASAAKRGMREVGGADFEIVIDGRKQRDPKAPEKMNCISVGDVVVQSDFNLLTMMAMGFSAAELVALFALH